MSMHLEGPWLSTTGKSKSKKKFRNAAEAQKARELEASWNDLKKKWSVEQENRKKKRALEAPVWTEATKVYRRQTEHIPSLNGGRDMSPAAKAPPKVYTGTLIKGIATMHKSNAVPVINDEQAKEISSMRR
jgi:hypothetical protein